MEAWVVTGLSTMRALLMPVRIFLDVSNKVTNSVTAVGFKQMPTYAPIRYGGGGVLVGEL